MGDRTIFNDCVALIYIDLGVGAEVGAEDLGLLLVFAAEELLLRCLPLKMDLALVAAVA